MKGLIVLVLSALSFSIFADSSVRTMALYRVCQDLGISELPMNCIATCTELVRPGDQSHYTLKLQDASSSEELSVELLDKANAELNSEYVEITYGVPDQRPYLVVRADKDSRVTSVRLNDLVCE